MISHVIKVDKCGRPKLGKGMTVTELLESYLRLQNKYQETCTQASATVIKYRDLLLTYGHHKYDCMMIGVDARKPFNRKIGWMKCSCGWTKIMKQEGWLK